MSAENDRNRALAISLATAEKESEVIDILKDAGYWDNYDYWRPFGDNDNNFSTIGNQQSASDAALVEKIINSVDAVLMKECLIQGIRPDSDEAPQSINDALYKFFEIREGQLSNLDKKTRNELSENIILAATGYNGVGKKKYLNLTIADRGEGQTPARMPETIMSISKNNKLKIPFVQGKFNMGGTGVLPFCGDNKFQLVISKRCPKIPNTDNDRTFNKWSVSIVRREEAREGRKSSMFTYLTDKNKNLLTFEAESLPIIPVREDEKYEEMQYGAYFKFFNYDVEPRLKTNVVFDLNYRLSMLMPELAHPIRIREWRSGYSGHTMAVTQSGLRVRLLEDRADNIENGFPTSEVFYIEGQEIRCSIYVFKKEVKVDRYRGTEGVLFVVNGQTHAAIRESFFSRVNLDYLKGSILVIVDCSDIDVNHREDMFMNSRDRLRSGSFVKKIEDQLKDILKNHAGLKKLQNERRAAVVKEKLNDDKPLQDVLQTICTKSPVLSKLLLTGERLSNPFNTKANAGDTDVFEGKRHPTFFKLKVSGKTGVLVKTSPINADFRVQFETDVENDYFSRPDERGKLEVYIEDQPAPESCKHLGLLNGVATQTISHPKGVKVGDEYRIKTRIIDNYIPGDFESEFKVVVAPPVEKTSDPNRDLHRTPPRDKDKDGKRDNPSSVGMPEVIEVEQNEWDQYEMDKDSALVVKTSDAGSDYYINMANQYLMIELKGIRDQNKAALTKAQYKYGMVLVGMGIESYYKNRTEEDDEDEDMADEIRRTTTMIAPVLIPMIQSMADLDLENV